MAKLKYYQLADKGGAFKKLISPNSSTISKMILEGWNFYGFDNEADIPANPVVDGDFVREMTEAEINAANAAAESERQFVKPLKLKQAENAYLTLLTGLTVSITAEDNSDSIITKLTASGMEKVDAVEIGLKLLNAVHEIELQGGSWYDLPTQLHNLEE